MGRAASAAIATVAEPGVVVANDGTLPDLRIPIRAHDLAGFRAWLHSGRFPEPGRIDFLGGDVELDMAPEDLQTHGTLKSAVAAELFSLVARVQRGYVFIDRTRVTSPAADLSVEPDVVVVLFPSLDQGRVRQVPAERKGPDRFIELEGAPDLVVEILSDSSENKDLERLPPRYAEAGVRELWLLDGRGAEPRFEVRALAGTAEYRRVEPDSEGWTWSPVLERRFRLTRQRVPHGWLYDLLQRT